MDRGARPNPEAASPRAVTSPLVVRRSVNRAAAYITLRRLEEKGFVSSCMGEPIAERGGKARRYVKLEAAGARALRDDVDGELHELYLKRRTDRGAGVAVAWY